MSTVLVHIAYKLGAQVPRTFRGKALCGAELDKWTVSWSCGKNYPEAPAEMPDGSTFLACKPCKNLRRTMKQPSTSLAAPETRRRERER